jgi:hypothetical protein
MYSQCPFRCPKSDQKLISAVSLGRSLLGFLAIGFFAFNYAWAEIEEEGYNR